MPIPLSMLRGTRAPSEVEEESRSLLEFPERVLEEIAAASRLSARYAREQLGGERSVAGAAIEGGVEGLLGVLPGTTPDEGKGYGFGISTASDPGAREDMLADIRRNPEKIHPLAAGALDVATAITGAVSPSRQARELYQPGLPGGVRTGLDIAADVGGMIAGAGALGSGAKIEQAATLAGRVGRGAVEGAKIGAIHEAITQGKDLSGQGMAGAAIGGAVGFAGGVKASQVARAIEARQIERGAATGLLPYVERFAKSFGVAAGTDLAGTAAELATRDPQMAMRLASGEGTAEDRKQLLTTAAQVLGLNFLGAHFDAKAAGLEVRKDLQEKVDEFVGDDEAPPPVEAEVEAPPPVAAAEAPVAEAPPSAAIEAPVPPAAVAEVPPPVAAAPPPDILSLLTDTPQPLMDLSFQLVMDRKALFDELEAAQKKGLAEVVPGKGWKLPTPPVPPPAAAVHTLPDTMVAAAEQAVIEHGSGSVKAIQKKLKVGFAKSGELMDILEARGIVGPAKGDGSPRELLSRPASAPPEPVAPVVPEAAKVAAPEQTTPVSEQIPSEKGVEVAEPTQVTPELPKFKVGDEVAFETMGQPARATIVAFDPDGTPRVSFGGDLDNVAAPEVLTTGSVVPKPEAPAKKARAKPKSDPVGDWVLAEVMKSPEFKPVSNWGRGEDELVSKIKFLGDAIDSGFARPVYDVGPGGVRYPLREDGEVPLTEAQIRAAKNLRGRLKTERDTLKGRLYHEDELEKATTKSATIYIDELKREIKSWEMKRDAHLLKGMEREAKSDAAFIEARVSKLRDWEAKLAELEGKPEVEFSRAPAGGDDANAKLASLRALAHTSTGHMKQVFTRYADELEASLRATPPATKKVGDLDVVFDRAITPDSSPNKKVYDETFAIVPKGNGMDAETNLSVKGYKTHPEAVTDAAAAKGKRVIAQRLLDGKEIRGRRIGNEVYVWGDVTPEVAAKIREYYPQATKVYQTTPISEGKTSLLLDHDEIKLSEKEREARRREIKRWEESPVFAKRTLENSDGERMSNLPNVEIEGGLGYATDYDLEASINARRMVSRDEAKRLSEPNDFDSRIMPEAANGEHLANGVVPVSKVSDVIPKIADALPAHMSELAWHLLPLVGDVKIRFPFRMFRKTMSGSAAEPAGAYVFGENILGGWQAIDVSLFKARGAGPEGAAKIILHEVVHAATVKAIKEGHESAVRIEELRRWLVKTKGSEFTAFYGSKNDLEFVAEAMSNSRFQNYLSKIPYKGDDGSPGKSVFRKFLDLVWEVLGGKGDAPTALDAAVRWSYDLMGESGNFPGKRRGTDEVVWVVKTDPKKAGVPEVKKARATEEEPEWDPSYFKMDDEEDSLAPTGKSYDGIDSLRAKLADNPKALAEAEGLFDGSLTLDKVKHLTTEDRAAAARAGNVRASVQEMIDRQFGKHASKVTLVMRDIIQDPQGRGVSGRFTPGMGEGDKGTVEVSLEALNTLGAGEHEVAHAILKHLLTAEDAAKVRSVFTPGTQTFKRLEEAIVKSKHFETGAKSEAEAAARTALQLFEARRSPSEAFSIYKDLRRHNLVDPPGWLGKIMDAVDEWRERLVSFVKGEGFRSFKDLMRAIDTGTYAALDGKVGVMGLKDINDAISYAMLQVAATARRNGAVARTKDSLWSGIEASLNKGVHMAATNLPYRSVHLTEAGSRAFDQYSGRQRYEDAFRRGIGAALGNSLKAANDLQRSEIVMVLRGEKTADKAIGLTDKMREDVTEARALIDKLTETMLKLDVPPEKLREVLEENLGKYVANVYELWERPGYGAALKAKAGPLGTGDKRYEDALDYFNQLSKMEMSGITPGDLQNLQWERDLAEINQMNEAAGQPPREATPRETARAEFNALQEAVHIVEGKIDGSDILPAEMVQKLLEARQLQIPDDVRNGNMNIINQMLDRAETVNWTGKGKGGGTGTKLAIEQFMARKNIPEPIQKLFGKVEDASDLFSFTTARQAQIVNAFQMAKAMANAKRVDGKPLFFDEANELEGATVQIPTTGAAPHRYGALAGKWTTPEVMAAFDDFDAGFGNGVMESLAKWLGRPMQLAATVFSTGSQMRNGDSNAIMSVTTGNSIFRPSNFKTYYIPAMKALAWAAPSLKRGEAPPASMAESVSIFKEAADNGVLPQGVVASMSLDRNGLAGLADKISAASNGTEAMKIFAKGVEGLGKVGAVAKDLYLFGDEWFRLAHWLKERDIQRAKFPDAPQAEINARAAEVTSALHVDYSRNPRFVKIFQQMPFAAPFLSFTAAMPRVMWNLWRYRPASAALYMGAVGAILAGLQPLLDREDAEDWRNLTKGLPEYERGGALMAYRTPGGNLGYVNLSLLLSIAGTMAQARDLAAAPFNPEGLNRTINAFFGGNPGFEGLSVLLSGRDSQGTEVVPEGAPITERGVGATKMVATSWLPPLAGGYEFQRLVRAAYGTTDARGRTTSLGSALAGSLTGVRPRDIQWDALYFSTGHEYGKLIDARSQAARRVLRNPNASEATRKAAVEELQSHLETFRRHVRDLEAFKRSSRKLGSKIKTTVHAGKNIAETDSYIRGRITTAENLIRMGLTRRPAQ